MLMDNKMLLMVMNVIEPTIIADCGRVRAW